MRSAQAFNRAEEDINRQLEAESTGKQESMRSSANKTIEFQKTRESSSWMGTGNCSCGCQTQKETTAT